MKKILSLACYLLVTTCYAKSNFCVYPPALQLGWDISAFEQCDQAIHRCPLTGMYLDEKCMHEKLKQKSCTQLSALTKLLDLKADMFTAKKVKDFTQITVNYPGDGGIQYYLLSSKGCLLDTSVNPSNINKKFKKEFAKVDLLNEVNGEPVYSVLPGSGKRFTVKIDGHRQCRACEIVVKATVAFDFTKDNVWKRATLLGFASAEKPNAK